MSTNPIGPMQATGIQPADQLTAPDAKKPVSDGTACPAMPRDQLTQSGATTSINDYRAAIESVGAATWGAAQCAEAALPSALELNPVTALGTVAAGAIFAAAGGQPLSREQATAIGAHEQMQFGGQGDGPCLESLQQSRFREDVANAGPAEYAPGAEPRRRPLAFERCRRPDTAAYAHYVSGTTRQRRPESHRSSRFLNAQHQRQRSHYARGNVDEAAAYRTCGAGPQRPYEADRHGRPPVKCG